MPSRERNDPYRQFFDEVDRHARERYAWMNDPKADSQFWNFFRGLVGRLRGRPPYDPSGMR